MTLRPRLKKLDYFMCRIQEVKFWGKKYIYCYFVYGKNELVFAGASHIGTKH